MKSPEEIAVDIKAEAKRLGFFLVGVAPAARPDTLDFFHRWLKEGHHGEMGYLARRQDAYAHPSGVLPGVRSVIMVGLNYFNESEPDGIGRIAKYATGSKDYHDVIRAKLKTLIGRIREIVPQSCSRAVVDTAPLLERDFARLAGLGWFGKNTMLINKQRGSYFFLGAILTDLEIAPDQPHETSHCGTCTRCLEACPTDAFDGPYTLDARKCISYLTIELRGELISEELRKGMGDWLFGCDVCQDVCPWNRKSEPTDEPEFELLRVDDRDAATILGLSTDEFESRFAGTPMSRTGRESMARNALIALGNAKNPESIPTIANALDDESPIVRASAAWAIGQIAATESIAVLHLKLQLEPVEFVRNELVDAIESLKKQAENLSEKSAAT